MAGVSKSVPFIKKRFEYALNRKGYSKNKFAKELFPDTKSPLRKLLRYIQYEEIPPEILEKIAYKLNVVPQYLQGTYSVTRNELDEKLVALSDDKEREGGLVIFDPEGYYYGFYIGYAYSALKEYRTKLLIEYLNSFTYESNDDDMCEVLDFNYLDERELDILEYRINVMIQECIDNPPNENWEKFITTSPYPTNRPDISALKAMKEDENDE